ncbi:hypothetical protein FVE85_6102 [Porphyridium purpureum]|uniref:Uncharacterized protein n=1 Tax=Porphyridium purpureum TaxID=35688 RepID=A0A5J4Z761_PORPP|nr:hypothetical protein FVE85_6102 [Porphyridium purpureum]|eukprot:POR9245..scf295_1
MTSEQRAKLRQSTVNRYCLRHSLWLTSRYTCSGIHCTKPFRCVRAPRFEREAGCWRCQAHTGRSNAMRLLKAIRERSVRGHASPLRLEDGMYELQVYAGERLKNTARTAPDVVQLHPSAFTATSAGGPDSSVVNMGRRAILSYVSALEFEPGSDPHLVVAASSDGWIELHDFEQLRMNFVKWNNSGDINSANQAPAPRHSCSKRTGSQRLCLDTGTRANPSVVRWSPEASNLLIGMRWSSNVWLSDLETCETRAPTMSFAYCGKSVLAGQFVDENVCVLGGVSGGINWFDRRCGASPVQVALSMSLSVVICALTLVGSHANLALAATENGQVALFDARFISKSTLSGADDTTSAVYAAAHAQQQEAAALHARSFSNAAAPGIALSKSKAYLSLDHALLPVEVPVAAADLAASGSERTAHLNWIQASCIGPNDIMFRSNHGRVGVMECSSNVRPVTCARCSARDRPESSAVVVSHSLHGEERHYSDPRASVAHDAVERMARRIGAQTPAMRRDVLVNPAYKRAALEFHSLQPCRATRHHGMARGLLHYMGSIPLPSLASCSAIHPHAGYVLVGYANNQVEVLAGLDEFAAWSDDRM